VDRQVGFDTNSLWLEMEPLRRFSDETLHFTSTPWLYQVKQQLAPGKYRIVLTLRFDLIDNQGQITSCQKFGRENLQVFEEFEIKK
jgi:hypothetical protein